MTTTSTVREIVIHKVIKKRDMLSTAVIVATYMLISLWILILAEQDSDVLKKENKQCMETTYAQQQEINALKRRIKTLSLIND